MRERQNNISEQAIKAFGDLKITDQNDVDFVFCGNWHCTCFECLRHHSHEPFNFFVRERKWEIENGKCEGKITDG